MKEIHYPPQRTGAGKPAQNGDSADANAPPLHSAAPDPHKTSMKDHISISSSADHRTRRRKAEELPG